MTVILLRNLFPEKKIKRRNTPCKFCNEKIERGEYYMSVNYNDGFKTKGFGAYHLECWNKYLIDYDKKIN